MTYFVNSKIRYNFEFKMNYYYTAVILVSAFIVVNSLDLPNNESTPGITEAYHNHNYSLANDNDTHVRKETEMIGIKTVLKNETLSSVSAIDNEVDQTKEITFNICCGKQQRLNPDNQCVDVKETLSKKVELLLQNFVVDSNMGHAFIRSSRFKYGHNLQSTCANGEILRFEWQINKTSYNFIDQDTGKLFDLYRHTRKISSVFSSSTYCIDQSTKEGAYIALVCPCSEKVCIPKCCERGFYFNTIQNKCKQESEDDVPKYETKLYDNTTEELSNEIHNYYVIHRQPKCQLERFIKNASDLRPLYVQSNGQLMAQLKGDKFDYLDNHRYCIDIFSSGNDSDTFVNGFFCSSTNNSNEEHVSLTRQSNVTYGDDSQNRMSFQMELHNLSLSGNGNKKSISKRVAEYSENKGKHMLSERSSSESYVSKISLMTFAFSFAISFFN